MCKQACLMLVAIAGASAVIAGGILGASSAIAEPTTRAAVRPVVGVATPVTVVAPSTSPTPVRLPESATPSAPARGPGALERFYGTPEEFDRALRASMIRPYDPNDDTGIAKAVVEHDTSRAIGPDPCNSCDPLDLDNPLSPDYDPSVIAVFQENDLLAPPDGPGFPTCQGVTTFWAGANDQCWGPNGASGQDADNVERQVPTLSDLGDHYAICGQIGRIDTTGYTGDPNNPTGPLHTEDGDVWELHVGVGQDIYISGYFEAPKLRMVMTFNGVLYQDEGYLGQFRDCNDGYYTWFWSLGFESTAPCNGGDWEEYLPPGYYYMLVEPRTEAAQGTPGAQLCEYWYNIEIEVADPIGACCLPLPGDPDRCVEDQLKTSCFAAGGVFRGNNSNCNTTICCDPLAELADQGLTADYTEGDTAFNPFTEQRCNIPGSTDTNPGCYRDVSGQLIPGAVEAGEAVQNSSGQLLDVCADPDAFVVVGYTGTTDAFEDSFLDSQFEASHDRDVFVFENQSGDSRQLTFDGFAVASGVWYAQGHAGGYPDAGAFNYSCDISGKSFLSALLSPCEHVDMSTCVPDGTTWAFAFLNFDGSGISCDTPYWFSVDCAPCPQVACCLPDGNCVDGLDEAECNNFIDPAAADGVPGMSWSSCCYVTCPNVCNGAGIPSGSVADDDCTSTDPNTGDLFNSGCDAPDGNPIGKFSTVGYPAAQEWCGSTGAYVRTLPSENPTVALAETDYYLLDLSSSSNDIGVRLTFTPSSLINLFIVPNRGESDCPTLVDDATTNIRELDNTRSYTVPTGETTVLNLCFEAGSQNMLVFEAPSLVACGTPYSVKIEYFTDGCYGACCNAYLNHNGSGIQGCTLLADDPSTGPSEAAAACASANLRGTWRGLNARCTGYNAVTCCTVASVGGDILDADNNVCPASNAANANRGCIGPAGGAFQALGNFAPGVGPNPGTTLSVWGAVCRSATGTPADSDFYSVNVTSPSGAEYLCTVESSAQIAVYAYTGADLGLPSSCSTHAPSRDSLFHETNPCVGPVTVAASGFNSEGVSYCLLGGQLNYFLVQLSQASPALASNDGVEAKYRMTLTAYECRTGACCLDASLCADDMGFLECEAVNGGQFVAGASCPDQAAGLALCRGVCCVDEGAGPPVCVPDTTAYDCCVLLNGGSFPFDSSFAGYTAGDLIFDINCATNPDVCEEGACCVDSISGYTCQDNLSAVQCGSLTGLFLGIDSRCADTACPEHPCCVGPNCAENFSPLECSNAGGVYKPLDATCATVACTPSGACCFSCTSTVTVPCPDPSGPIVQCNILTQAQCLAARGVYVGNNTTCSQGIGGPCDCNGDINGDGNVNASDFNILAGSFNLGNPDCRTRGQGDLNCDGIVNASDFNILAGSFNCVRN